MEKPSDFWLCASGAQSAITLVWNLLEWFSQPQGSLVGLGCAGIQQSRKFVIFSCPYRSLLPVHLEFIHTGISFISLVALALLFSSVRDPTKREAAELCVVPFPGAATRPWVGCHQSTLDRTVLGSSSESYRAYWRFVWQIVITRRQSFCSWLPEHDRAILYQLPVISWIIHGFKNW